MCKKKTPKVTPAEIPAEPPTQVDAEVQGARADEKKRQRAAAGYTDTIVNAQGLGGVAANTGRTTLGGN